MTGLAGVADRLAGVPLPLLRLVTGLQTLNGRPEFVRHGLPIRGKSPAVGGRPVQCDVVLGQSDAAEIRESADALDERGAGEQKAGLSAERAAVHGCPFALPALTIVGVSGFGVQAAEAGLSRVAGYG